MRVLGAIPGVVSVSSSSFLPWQGGGSSTQVKIPDSSGAGIRTQIYYGTPEIFKTLGHDVHIINGRGLAEGDMPPPSPAGMLDGVPAPGTTAPPAQDPLRVVITKALADLMFKTANPVGRLIADTGGKQDYLIIGVVDHFYNPYPWPIHEFSLFAASPVGSYSRGTRFLLRAEPGAMKSVLSAIEPQLLRANDGRNIEVRTVAEVKDQFFSGGRLTIRIMTAVICLLVFITAVGILGVSSFAVTERTRQIGTRRALGATRGDILRYFLLENWLITTTGLVLGVAVAYALNYLLVTQVSGPKLQWQFLAIGAVILWVTGLAATLAPAIRGTNVSPAIATRSV